MMATWGSDRQSTTTLRRGELLTESDNGTEQVEVQKLEEPSPLLQGEPWLTGGLSSFEPMKRNREDARVKCGETEVGVKADIR